MFVEFCSSFPQSSHPSFSWTRCANKSTHFLHKSIPILFRLVSLESEMGDSKVSAPCNSVTAHREIENIVRKLTFKAEDLMHRRMVNNKDIVEGVKVVVNNIVEKNCIKGLVKDPTKQQKFMFSSEDELIQHIKDMKADTNTHFYCTLCNELKCERYLLI